MLRPRERLGHVTRCLLSAASGGASSSSGGGGIAAAADPTSAAEDKTSQRQRLWSGLSGTGDPRGRLTVPPQFRSVADGTPPPHLHDAGADPRSREELARRHDEMRGLYEGRGYVVCRGFLSSEQVQECRSATARIIDDWPHRTAPAIRDAPGPPFVDLDPRVVAGEVEPASPQLAVRRLFRIATHEEVFRRRIVEDEDLLGLTKALLGEDLKLVQSMALLKPPGTGEKRWHQDQGVMRLTPDSVCGWWIALDPTDLSNGCMQLWPGSHKNGLVPHHLPVPDSPAAHMYYSVRDAPPPAEVVAVPMQPGDALCFNVSVVHGSGPNTSCNPPRRRWAIQMQYAPGHCRVTRCPEPGSAEARALGVASVRRAVGEVFEHVHRRPTTPDHLRAVAFEPPPPNGATAGAGAGAKTSGEMAQPFDCECVEPQFWSYRKAEMHVCGRDDFGPDAI